MVPGGQDVVVEYRGEPVRSFFASSTLTPEVRGLVETDFQTRRRPIMRDGAPKVVDPAEKKSAKPPGNVIGMCLCSDRGTEVHRMRNAFLRHTKRIINNDAMKDLVDDCS
eukprot:8471158-Pyramimonas_sp.AAC.1